MVEDFMCNLKVYRVAQGLTQEQLAEKVGVALNLITKVISYIDFGHTATCQIAIIF